MSKARGEVSIEADGKRYVLVYSTNAICELEDRLDDGVAALSKLALAGKRFKIIRTVFLCGLLDNHPELTEKDAGRIIDAISLDKADALIVEAFGLAFPSMKAVPVPLDSKPAEPRARTGKRS
jgi:hypothetical protein